MKIALTVSLIVFLMEIFGGFVSNSLALLSDAVHVLSDMLAIMLALWAAILASRPHTSLYTYGYHRAEVLAALINGIGLAGISIYLLTETFGRFFNPAVVEGQLMTLFTSAGLAANVFTLAILREGYRRSLNMKGVFLHVLGDTASSVIVLLGAAVITLTGFHLADAVAAVAVNILIMFSATRLVLDSLAVLMEASPKHIDVRDVAENIRKVDGVVDVHDIHVWTITTNLYAISCHIVVAKHRYLDVEKITEEVRRLLRGKYGIEHITIQAEITQPGFVGLDEIKRR
ncbi:MAG: cation diffusion facilitator family transporter [Nitrososphaerota archaeon]